MAKKQKSSSESSYASKMFDFVWENYQHGISWEKARDLLHEKYQSVGRIIPNWSSIDKKFVWSFLGISFGASD